MICELIVVGYSDPHTAFLARAALARLQGELSLSGQDVAIVTRDEAGETHVLEPVTLDSGPDVDATFWASLVALFFSREALTPADSDAIVEKLAALGIDPAFRSRIPKQIQPGTAALLVRVRGATTRDQVLGVLRGLGGEIAQVPFRPETPEPADDEQRSG